METTSDPADRHFEQSENLEQEDARKNGHGGKRVGAGRKPGTLKRSETKKRKRQDKRSKDSPAEAEEPAVHLTAGVGPSSSKGTPILAHCFTLTVPMIALIYLLALPSLFHQGQGDQNALHPFFRECHISKAITIRTDGTVLYKGRSALAAASGERASRTAPPPPSPPSQALTPTEGGVQKRPRLDSGTQPALASVSATSPTSFDPPSSYPNQHTPVLPPSAALHESLPRALPLEPLVQTETETESASVAHLPPPLTGSTEVDVGANTIADTVSTSISSCRKLPPLSPSVTPVHHAPPSHCLNAPQVLVQTGIHASQPDDATIAHANTDSDAEINRTLPPNEDEDTALWASFDTLLDCPPAALALFQGMSNRSGYNKWSC